MKNKKTQSMTIPADASGVKCDGGSGPLGHPAVWYDFDGKDSVTCLYCGQVFVKKKSKNAA